MTTARFLDHRGCRLSYQVRGEGGPVLFIQGVGVHGDGWLPQVEALAGSYRCLWFDNRGMGQSQPVGTPLTVEQMAEDGLALMDSQGWNSAHVVGHSLGGLIALHLALTARARVRSLALLCTFARGLDVTRPSPRMLWLGLRTRLGPRRARRRAFLRLVMPEAELAKGDEDRLAERLAPLFGHDLADQPAIVSQQLRAMSNYDASGRLAELSGLPTLVVSASDDMIAPLRLGRALAAGVNGARYVEVEDAAHGVTIQRAERINGLLKEHWGAASG